MIKINLELNQGIITQFESIANDLFNKWVLKVNNKEYRLAEIEFYVKIPDLHEDEYVHGHDLQKENGKWYFHGSGLDFTFGNRTYWASFLIRAIQDIKCEKSYIYGPLNTVTEIFENFNIADNNKLDFGFFPNYKLDIQKVIAAPRVGLNPEKCTKFYDKKYRFLIFPKKKHADKTKIEKAMIDSTKYTESEIKNIWG